jgi:hypothetical protein
VCAKTVSDWGHAQRWNPIVANRAFAGAVMRTLSRRPAPVRG